MQPINVWAPHFNTFDFKAVDIVPCSIWFARIVRVFSLKKLLLFLRKKKHIEAIVFFDLFCLSTHASWLLIGRTRTLSWNRAIFICLSYAWALPFVLSKWIHGILLARETFPISDHHQIYKWHQFDTSEYLCLNGWQIAMFQCMRTEKKRFNVDKLLFDFQFALKSAI